MSFSLARPVSTLRTRALPSSTTNTTFCWASRSGFFAAVPGALPGMSGQATISTETRDQALIVPLQAVTVRTEKQLAADAKDKKDAESPDAPGTEAKKNLREPMQKVVFVVEDGKAKVRRVETGLASENDIELVSGVKEGDVVVEGPYKLLSRDLADGKPVKDDDAAKAKAKATDAPKVSGDAKDAKKEGSGS